MLLLQALQIRTPIMSQPRRNMQPSVMKAQVLSSDSVSSPTYRYQNCGVDSIQGTLDAYIDKYSSMVQFLSDNASGTPSSDAPPAEQTSKSISLQVS